MFPLPSHLLNLFRLPCGEAKARHSLRPVVRPESSGAGHVGPFCSIPSAAGGRGEDFFRYRAGSLSPCPVPSGAGPWRRRAFLRSPSPAKCRFWRKTGAQNYAPNCSGKQAFSQGFFGAVCSIISLFLYVLQDTPGPASPGGSRLQKRVPFYL